MSTAENDDGLNQQCAGWLANRDRCLLAKAKAREIDGAHFSLNPSAFDPECLAEPLRSMAMRALDYPEALIKGAPDARRTFTDFARLHSPRGENLDGVEFSPSIDDAQLIKHYGQPADSTDRRRYSPAECSGTTVWQGCR